MFFRKIVCFCRKGKRGQERGFTLIECLVAVALLASIGVGFLSALTTSTNATGVVEKKVDIDQLARTQLEYIKGLNYIRESDYSSINYYPSVEEVGLITLTGDYDIVVSAPQSVIDGGGSADEDIQKITVIIKRGSDSLLTLEGYKVNR